jgi:hypothetical protein
MQPVAYAMDDVKRFKSHCTAPRALAHGSASAHERAGGSNRSRELRVTQRQQSTLLSEHAGRGRRNLMNRMMREREEKGLSVAQQPLVGVVIYNKQYHQVSVTDAWGEVSVRGQMRRHLSSAMLAAAGSGGGQRAS